jgi:hypothetical protein
MKVYLQGLLFSILVAFAYYFIDLRFFSLNILKSVRVSLFNTFQSENLVDQNIILYNTGTMPDTAIVAKVRFLLTTNPKAIGINTCDLQDYEIYSDAFGNNPQVMIANCPGGSGTQLGSILEDGNTVTHFKTDASTFEIKLANRNSQRARANEIERINFQSTGFYKSELKEPLLLENNSENIFIVGYMGDYISPDEMYYFDGARITPLNPDFGKDENVSPDTYDIEIAAHIISTIQNDRFIDEVPLWARVLIIFGFCLANVVVIMMVKTRWIIMNVAIYTFTFFLLIMIASLAIVYLFSGNVYLNLDGLEILLLITSVFTAFSTPLENRISQAPTTT